MLELPHAMVGAAIATLIPNPVIALPLALVSHFIGDYIPHWNPSLVTEKKLRGHIRTSSLLLMTIDCSLALVFGFYLASRSSQPWVILLACLMAVLPDVVEIPHFFFNMKIAVIEKLLSFQRSHQWNVPMLWGVLTQILVVAICFYFILSA